jgi:hypothetical protein
MSRFWNLIPDVNAQGGKLPRVFKSAEVGCTVTESAGAWIDGDGL